LITRNLPKTKQLLADGQFISTDHDTMKSMKQEDETRVVCFKPDDVKCDDENDLKKGTRRFMNKQFRREGSSFTPRYVKKK